MRGAARICLALVVCGALAAAACAACGGEAARRPASVFEDPGLARWTLAPSPRLAIGGDDERDGYLIGSLAGALLLGDRLVVADGSARELRFYSLSGQLLVRAGRKGAGPGEFQAIRGLAASDDTTVVAWDPMLQRLTLFGLDGTLRRTVSPDLERAIGILPTFVGTLRGGHFVFRDERSTLSLKGSPTGERRDSLQYLVLAPDGSPAALWKEPGKEVFYREAGRLWNDAPILFGRNTLETVAGGDLVVGSTDTLRLERIAPDGSVRHRTTLPWTPTRVRAEWVESERKRLFQQEKDRFERLFVRLAGLDPARAAADLATLDEQYRMLPHRRTLPAFGALRSDPLGQIWVAAPTVPGFTDSTTWAVLDSLFRPVATIRVPAHLEVLGLGPAHLLGATRDTLGRITIGLYPVIRPGRRPETDAR